MASSGNNKPPAGSSTSAAASAGRQHPTGIGDDEENKVDFIHRTMLEREASGKRKIKPTYLPETVFMEDSDDPDFDVEDEDSGSDSNGNGSSSDSDDDSKSKGSQNSDSDGSGKDDSGSDSDSSDSSKSDSGSDSDSSDDSSAPKNSLLRTMMAKLDQEAPIIPQKRRKKKPKPKPTEPKTEKSELSAEVMASVLSTIRAESTAKSSASSTDSKTAPNRASSSKAAKKRPSKPAKRPSTDKSKKVSEGIKKKANKKTSSATKESRKKKEKKKKKQRESISKMVAACDAGMENTRENVDYTVHPLCSICLSHKPTAGLNEVVQCDSCRLNCHEECYSLLENEDDTASSSSTSPWFCDACKAGKKELFCELCPSQGGLFKQTGNRLWVHKICAMYTSGAFGGNDKFPADLSGIGNSKWGGKVCSACDDETLARVGIPVRCDAAMCKEHFHITCAQRLGLLSDPYCRSETIEADPLFVTCRAHISSALRKRQAEAYRIAQEQTRRKLLRLVDFEPRIQEKLQHTRTNYLKQFNNEDEVKYDNERARLVSIPVEPEQPAERPDADAAALPQKRARLLENSAAAVLTNQRKAEFSHYDVEAMLLQEKHEKTVQRVSKMWNVPPGITVTFAAYYADRQRRIKDLTLKHKKENEINTSFTAKEKRLNKKLETVVVKQMVENDKTLQIKNQERILRDIIAQIKSPQSTEKSTRKSKSPTRQTTGKKSSLRGETSPQQLVRSSSREIKGNGLLSTQSKIDGSKKIFADGRLELHMCSVCSRSEKQHLIIRCDKCRKHYHLGCLDPPLTKRPRITSTCGWMCADCDEKDKEEEEEEPVVDVDAPRALRGRTSIKKPVKYTSDHESDFEDSLPAKQVKISPPTRIKKEKESQPPRVRPEKKKSIPPKVQRRVLVTKSNPTENKSEQRLSSSFFQKRDGTTDPFKLHMSGDKMSPVVNLGLNGAMPPKTSKPPAKRRSPSNTKQADIKAVFSPSDPFAFASVYKCGICDRLGAESSLVKCDNCSVNFHFMCLNPPTEYTPKRKGYKWYCTNCDDADDEIPMGLNS